MTPESRLHGSLEVPGELAQLGERLVCNQEVTGSIPVFSTSTVRMLCSVVRGFTEDGI